MDRGSESTAAPDPKTQQNSFSCPSAPAAPGVVLLGLLGPGGRINNLRTPMKVDAAFLEAAGSDGPVERRMRFAGRCQTDACAQWTGTRCGVIDRAMEHLEQALPQTAASDLPACAIRADCRWFSQRGRTACGTCAYIVTDTR